MWTGKTPWNPYSLHIFDQIILKSFLLSIWDATFSFLHLAIRCVSIKGILFCVIQLPEAIKDFFSLLLWKVQKTAVFAFLLTIHLSLYLADLLYIPFANVQLSPAWRLRFLTFCFQFSSFLLVFDLSLEVPPLLWFLILLMWMLDVNH